MRGPARSISTHRRQLLSSGWQMLRVPPGSVSSPAALPQSSSQWHDCTVPGTVAGALRAAGHWSLDAPPRQFDAEEWWFRTRFDGAQAGREKIVLGLDGLATLAEVWLDGQVLFTSGNMFVGHEVVIEAPRAEHELIICFRALDAALAERRPRPRWKSPMIGNQQLRWLRTTLLGRTPGWSPPASPIGPWRDVWLERRTHLDVDGVELQARLDGTAGRLEAAVRLIPYAGERIAKAELILTRGTEQRVPMQLDQAAGRWIGSLEVRTPQLWWPHTHGEPALYQARLLVLLQSEAQVEIDLGNVGFRSVRVATENGRFAVVVNDTPIFCRGACWTPLDPVTLGNDSAQLQRTIEQVRAAGMNMLRVGGTMVYETDDFLDACDANGILLWQEFMFANMDYPAGDAAFLASVRHEARQQVARLAARPAVAVLCGNSEVEQQASMWGAPRELWSPALFHEELRSIANELCPGVPYWPSSAHGGAFPHQPAAGTCSYYGVGAYLRTPEDARRSDLSFATECLAFANVPEDASLTAMPGGLSLRAHHPQWKARTPRDLGAGWDFEDVRDHYLRLLLGIDPVLLRYTDHDGYLELSRIVPGLAMAAAFAEWRREHSGCGGALIWWLRDLWVGAGWGIVDSLGVPKAPYYYAKRVLQPLAVFVTDEGLNGPSIQLVNERGQRFEGTLELSVYRNCEIPLANAARAVAVVARGTHQIPALAIFENFADLTYAYRFGPMASDLLVARLRDPAGAIVAEAMYSPPGTERRTADAGLKALAHFTSEDEVQVTISAQRLARAVTLAADGFMADDQYFDVAPQGEKIVTLRRNFGHTAKFKGTVKTVHSLPTKIEIAG